MEALFCEKRVLEPLIHNVHCFLLEYIVEFRDISLFRILFWLQIEKEEEKKPKRVAPVLPSFSIIVKKHIRCFCVGDCSIQSVTSTSDSQISIRIKG